MHNHAGHHARDLHNRTPVPNCAVKKFPAPQTCLRRKSDAFHYLTRRIWYFPTPDRTLRCSNASHSWRFLLRLVTGLTRCLWPQEFTTYRRQPPLWPVFGAFSRVRIDQTVAHCHMSNLVPRVVCHICSIRVKSIWDLDPLPLCTVQPQFWPFRFTFLPADVCHIISRDWNLPQVSKHPLAVHLPWKFCKMNDSLRFSATFLFLTPLLHPRFSVFDFAFVFVLRQILCKPTDSSSRFHSLDAKLIVCTACSNYFVIFEKRKKILFVFRFARDAPSTKSQSIFNFEFWPDRNSVFEFIIRFIAKVPR